MGKRERACAVKSHQTGLVYLDRGVGHVDLYLAFFARRLFGCAWNPAQAHVAFLKVLSVACNLIENVIDLLNDEIFSNLVFHAPGKALLAS